MLKVTPNKYHKSISLTSKITFKANCRLRHTKSIQNAYKASQAKSPTYPFYLKLRLLIVESLVTVQRE